jgi:hypothetical protein
VLFICFDSQHLPHFFHIHSAFFAWQTSSSKVHVSSFKWKESRPTNLFGLSIPQLKFLVSLFSLSHQAPSSPNPQETGHVRCHRKSIHVKLSRKLCSFSSTHTICFFCVFMCRAKTEEPDFFELEKTSPLPTLAETKFRLEARKMKRLKKHFESDAMV